jgi:hypothetical protein
MVDPATREASKKWAMPTVGRKAAMSPPLRDVPAPEGPALQYHDSDDCFARLKVAGWSVVEVGSASGRVVLGYDGENVLRAEAPTLAEAYARACDQAALCGMLRPPVQGRQGRPPCQFSSGRPGRRAGTVS